MRLLLANPQTDVNRGKSDGATALMLAAANGQTKVVELLLRHPKIQVNNQGGTQLRTVLSLHDPICEHLLIMHFVSNFLQSPQILFS